MHWTKFGFLGVENERARFSVTEDQRIWLHKHTGKKRPINFVYKTFRDQEDIINFKTSRASLVFSLFSKLQRLFYQIYANVHK